MSDEDGAGDESVAIEVPVPVYLQLQRYADFGETPVQALQRLLGAPAPRGADVIRRRSGTVGALVMLVEHGLLGEGDEVEYRRARRGEYHLLTVTADGFLQLADGRRCGSPSGVIAEISGTTDNGWKLLRHLRTGCTLGELRDRAQRAGVVVPKSTRSEKPYSSVRSLIDMGAVAVGDVLTGWHDGQELRATVGAEGTIVFGHDRYPNPSKAWAVAIGKGTSDQVTHAWQQWVHDRSGKTLYDLREDLIASREQR